MIFGAMPKWRQWFHFCASCFMCLLFSGVALFVAISIFRGARPRDAAAPAPLIVGGLLFVIVAIVGAGLQFLGRRRIIRQFSYDGRELRFRTLGTSGEQVWRLADITAVQQSRGREPEIGYRVSRRDGRYVILDYAVQNSAAAALRMQLDIQLLQSRPQ